MYSHLEELLSSFHQSEKVEYIVWLVDKEKI